MNFIIDNFGTIIVGIVLILTVGLVLLKMRKDKKMGKSCSCGTGCSGCSGNSMCHSKK